MVAATRDFAKTNSSSSKNLKLRNVREMFFMAIGRVVAHFELAKWLRERCGMN